MPGVPPLWAKEHQIFLNGGKTFGQKSPSFLSTLELNKVL